MGSGKVKNWKIKNAPHEAGVAATEHKQGQNMSLKCSLSGVLQSPIEETIGMV